MGRIILPFGEHAIKTDIGLMRRCMYDASHAASQAYKNFLRADYCEALSYFLEHGNREICFHWAKGDIEAFMLGKAGIPVHDFKMVRKVSHVVEDFQPAESPLRIISLL